MIQFHKIIYTYLYIIGTGMFGKRYIEMLIVITSKKNKIVNIS